MANLVVKVRRETIVACMTCPLCDKLFRDATTISECLHTFCRKCIYEKISDEELESCPICNIDLGCAPLEKLRPDNCLQDVRAKIFPFKRRKVTAPEVPSVMLPIRRKERSLSSLVVSTPKVSSQSSMTGRRTRGAARKASAFRNSASSVEKTVKKEDRHPESLSSPEIENNSIRNVRRSSSPGKPSEALPVKEIENENGAESHQNKMDLWKPLNCLVEAANRTKSFRRKSKVMDENHVDPANLELEKPKKLSRIRRKRRADSEELAISPQLVLGANHERRYAPIWFSLVASDDQEGDASLPQIPVNYLRIKDGNIPVSFVQKYLMKKLNLGNETEVEIKCMGESVSASLKLYNLIDLWLKSSLSQRIQASIGSSAKDLVMVLSYSRKL